MIIIIRKKKRKPEPVLERKTTACPISRKEARLKKMFAKHSDPGPTVLVLLLEFMKKRGRAVHVSTNDSRN